MSYNNLRELGSQTARDGFKNEDDVVRKFKSWRTDQDAQKWLMVMQYDLSEIEHVDAVKIPKEKTDVQVQIVVKTSKALDVQNLQVKLVSNEKGFNQIDKRWIKNYAELWEMPKKVYEFLQHFTGELPPFIKNPRDNRRMFADEFSEPDQKAILEFLNSNKTMIVSDILKGRGKFAAEWMLVIQKTASNARWVLKPMNFVVNYFGNGPVEITKQGSFKIGRITIQRKGGDGGRETARMLQFKINPAELFEA